MLFLSDLFDDINEDRNVRVLKPTGLIGLESVPFQYLQTVLQNDVEFNIMCVGETGLGKSTLIDTLFNISVGSKPISHFLDKTGIKARTYMLEEGIVNLKLTICDTMGYGDQINKYDTLSITSYIDDQFEKYMIEEMNLIRSLSMISDSRVHVCLYFISPTGHSLKPLDLLCLKQLESRVNIIPIIAKADAFTLVELRNFKLKIRAELKRSKVDIYQFPTSDEMDAELNSKMNGRVPFSVVGSNEFVEIDSEMVRARQYPWGTVQPTNEKHCELAKLRELLLYTNMEDLRERTHKTYYELYRQTRLHELVTLNVKSEFQRAINARELLFRSIGERINKKNDEFHEIEREMLERFNKLEKQLDEKKSNLDRQSEELAEEYKQFTKYKKYFIKKQTIEKKPKQVTQKKLFSEQCNI